METSQIKISLVKCMCMVIQFMIPTYVAFSLILPLVYAWTNFYSQVTRRRNECITCSKLCRYHELYYIVTAQLWCDP